MQATGKENEVLLDENLVECMSPIHHWLVTYFIVIYESPLFLREHAKQMLRTSLWNDTLFLAKMNVMDYSLVIGVDDSAKELVVGIVGRIFYSICAYSVPDLK